MPSCVNSKPRALARDIARFGKEPVFLQLGFSMPVSVHTSQYIFVQRGRQNSDLVALLF